MSLRVLHLSTYASNGGAARAATALDSALEGIGIESRLMTATGAKFRIAREFDRQLWRLQRSPVEAWRSPARFGSLTAAEINASSADVIDLHWVTDGFMSIEEIGKITKPVVWSLYDMWTFCGTEHYGVDSPTARWRTGYSRENRPGTETGMDIDRWAWNRKRAHWTPMTMVPASTWLAESARGSALLSDWPIARIPHVVDTDRYAPMGKQDARRHAGLPVEGPLILFLASAGIFDARKGFDLLEQGLPDMFAAHPKARVVVVGPESPGYESASGMPIIWHGTVDGDEQLRALYCSADVVAVPSREDNMPLTAMEAQSCGVPVVAFDIGGLPDIVVDGETGFLSQPGRASELGLSLKRLLDDEGMSQDFGTRARQHALETWSPSVIARAYQQLYEDLLS